MKPLLRRQRATQPSQPSHTVPRSQVFRRLMGYVAHYQGALFWVVLAALINTGLNLAVTYFLGQGINNLVGPRDLDLFRQTALIMLLCGVLGCLALLVQGLLLAKITQRSIYDLRRQLFNHVMTLSLNFFDRRPIGELMSSLSNDTEVIAQFFRTSLNTTLSEATKLVFIVIIMVWLNWQLAIAALTIAPLVLALLGFVGQFSTPAFRQLQGEVAELNGLMEETISGQKVVIAYNRQNESIDSFTEISLAARTAGKRARFIAMMTRPVTAILTNLDIALVSLVGGLLALNGQADVGTVAIFLQYTRQLALPITSISNAQDQLLAALSSAERVFKVMDDRPAIQNDPAAFSLPPIQGHVVFKDVNFAYVPNRPVLKHNSFEALPGQKIGLCGPTGAGKSTLINLITRYYDIDSGDILIDGHSIYDVQKDSLRQQIGIVLQEPFLFSDTVMNNLRYACLDATEKDCIEAAKQANAHEFIQRLPNGYDTLLTERGSNLSQGQRQLLTIARMMVQNPRLVILDEATSNVDTRTEQHIQAALTRLMAGRTSFVIAHRLSTIRDSDQILVLESGEIVESGTHDSLMQRQGLYHDLYMSQFKGKLAAVAGNV